LLEWRKDDERNENILIKPGKDGFRKEIMKNQKFDILRSRSARAQGLAALVDRRCAVTYVNV
jgi:hypothetical protein